MGAITVALHLPGPSRFFGLISTSCAPGAPSLRHRPAVLDMRDAAELLQRAHTHDVPSQIDWRAGSTSRTGYGQSTSVVDAQAGMEIGELAPLRLAVGSNPTTTLAT
jgi:hypothetical protein